MPESDHPPGSTSNAGDSSPRGGDNLPSPPSSFNGTSSGEVLQPGASIARRFTLTRLIGRGGMGVVWEARDMSLGREVAIKFLGNEVATDPEAVADLRRETRRSLELTHPNIVRIYDYVEDPQLRLVGISMELLTGMSVQMLKLEQPQRAFTPEKVLPWLRQICGAIDYAHQVVGVIHRDIKPGNLFVNERGSLKIVDFGIAMVVRDSTSRLVQEARLSRSGTLAYMSHQQLKGDKPTPADDMYAIGALLYELFTSKPPFFRGDAHALMHQIMSQPPMPIAERQQELDVTGITVPPSWEAAIMACLSKDAAVRPASGQALLDMIAGQTVQSSGDATVLASAFVGKKVDLDKTMVMGRAAAMSSADATMLASNSPSKVPPPLPNAANPVPGVGTAIPPPPEKEKKKPSWLSTLSETSLKTIVTTALTLLVSALIAWLSGAFESSADGLVIDVEPRAADAQIAIDGRLPVSLPEKGPLIIPDVADGQHSVSVEAKGFVRFRDYVVLKKGKGKIDVKLSPAFGSLELIARPGSRYTLTPRPPDKPSGGEVGSSGKILLEKLRVGEFQLRVEHPDCLVADLGEVPIAADEITYRRAVQKTIPASAYVTSEPHGASILIDGNSRGITPFEIVDLPAEANLAIEARLEGYEPARANLNLKPGQRQNVSFDMKQVRGTLIVAARPGTHVIARRAGQPNIPLGTIGPSGEETFAGILPQGRYSIALEHPDLQPETPSDVEIDPAKTNRISAKQVLWGSSLDVRSEPEGATVLINGALRGTTPTVIGGLPSGTPLAVELRLRGKNPVNRIVTLRPRETGSLMVDRFTAERLSVKVDVQPWDTLRGRTINFVVDGARVPPNTSSGSIFEVPIEDNGLHTVQVEADGYQPRSIRFDSNAGNSRPYRIELEALPAARVASVPPASNASGAQTRRDSVEQANGFGGQPSNIVPQDADNTGGIKLVRGPSAKKVVDAIKTVAERRGWTVSKIDGDVVMLTLKKRGYDATVYCRYSAGGVEFMSDSYRAGRLPGLGGKSAKTIPSGWIDNLKEDLSELLNER